MLSEKRFFEILKIVEEKKSVTVQELTDMLNTSESTIRRDLTILHNEGKLNKVHGGATALGLNYYMKDDEVAYRQDLNMEEKKRIAIYAASLIKENDFVYIDAGTTTELMIDYIEQTNVTFVTNATVHAKKLVQRGYKTYILGGELKLATEAVVGSEAVLSVQKFNFTKGFWGANGVSKVTGFSTPELSEAMIKQKSMERCKEKYVLCDASKFNQIAPVTFAEFNSAFIITTRIDDETYSNCKNILEVKRV